eukprot:c21564_g1_i6.p1 GENE.c21564_g1_i6~~c21564_g1_i6.p1  ORF type:complete len:258 (+),score=95.09 c21564_g1_i6:52-825(+)
MNEVDQSQESPSWQYGSNPQAIRIENEGTQVPAFLNKTYEIVDNPANNHIIAWSDSGVTFIVYDTGAFCSHILPAHFKHNNLASFVRQLNIYGFQKVGSKNLWEFRHDKFRRDERHQLPFIKRKSPTRKSWMTENSNDEQRSEVILTELIQLKQRQELLEMNLVQVMNTNDTLWNDLIACKQQQREIQDNLQKVLYFLMSVHQADDQKNSQLSGVLDMTHGQNMSGSLSSLGSGSNSGLNDSLSHHHLSSHHLGSQP